jgi:predicted protein tyrosine phosphatase
MSAGCVETNGLKKILFVCSENRLRSPTAEQVFSQYPGAEVASAGTNSGCANPISTEVLEWADVIMVMEQRHKKILQKRFGSVIREKKLVVLGIPDDFEFMDKALITVLLERVPQFL